MKKVESIQPGQAGFRIKQFARACGFSVRTFYELPEEQQPKSVKMGRARIIVESPREYLERMATVQAQQPKAA